MTPFFSSASRVSRVRWLGAALIGRPTACILSLKDMDLDCL